MSDEYKRQIDNWIKISVILTPLLSGAVSWGIINTKISTLSNHVDIVERRMVTVEDKLTTALIEWARVSGASTEQLKEVNRRLASIEVIMDSRLQRR